MRNFQQVAKGVDTVPLLLALAQQPELWNANALRTTHEASPHTQVEDIWLRFNSLTNGEAAVVDEHESVCWPAWWSLPQAQGLIYGLMARTYGIRLGRVIITRLAPGKSIAPHVDGGEHAAYYERYHIMLQNYPGSTFRCGGEDCWLAPGDIWWFDNGKEHEVVNNGSGDRITLIVDLARAKS